MAFRVITGNAQPYFTTVNEFRRVHREHFRALFVEVLKLCRRAGLVKLRHVAIDGAKVKANASKHKAMSYKRMLQEERRLRSEVERLLNEAEAGDALDDARFGPRSRGDELPEELRRRESRLERIREAKAALEAEALKTRAHTLLEQAERHARTAQTHPEAVVRSRARTNAAKRRAKVKEFDRDDDPPGGGSADGELARKPTLATPQGRPVDEAQRNFTDPESSIMMGTDGFTQAYNAQLAVDEARQIIVACGVTDQPLGCGALRPHARTGESQHRRCARACDRRCGVLEPAGREAGAGVGHRGVGGHRTGAPWGWGDRPRAPATRPMSSAPASACAGGSTPPRVERGTRVAKPWLSLSTVRSSTLGASGSSPCAA